MGNGRGSFKATDFGKTVGGLGQGIRDRNAAAKARTLGVINRLEQERLKAIDKANAKGRDAARNASSIIRPTLFNRLRTSQTKLAGRTNEEQGVLNKVILEQSLTPRREQLFRRTPNPNARGRVGRTRPPGFSGA